MIIVNNSRNLFKLWHTVKEKKKYKSIGLKTRPGDFFRQVVLWILLPGLESLRVGISCWTGIKVELYQAPRRTQGTNGETYIFIFFKKTVKITHILNLRSSISETP